MAPAKIFDGRRGNRKSCLSVDKKELSSYNLGSSFSILLVFSFTFILFENLFKAGQCRLPYPRYILLTLSVLFAPSKRYFAQTLSVLSVPSKQCFAQTLSVLSAPSKQGFKLTSAVLSTTSKLLYLAFYFAL